MKSLFAILFSLFAILCFGQKNFQEGFIVTTAGDTLRGFINYPEREKNPVSVEFKQSLQNSSSQTYTVKDTRFFEITGLEQYIRCTCNISLDNRGDINKLSDFMDTANKTETILLRKIASGNNVQLFSYVDEIKTRFYIQADNATIPKELIFRMYLDLENGARVIERPDYKNQLKQYATTFNINPSSFQQKLEKAKYNVADLRALVNLINNNTESNADAEKKFRSIRFFINAGLNRASFQFTGSKDFGANSFSFSTSNLPVFAIGFDGFFNPKIGRAFMRQELSFMINQHNGQSTYYSIPESYYLKQAIFSLSSSYLYNLYNKSSVKVFVGAGAAINFTKTIENKIEKKGTGYTSTVEGYDFRSITMSALGRAGVLLVNQWEVSFTAVVSLVPPTENYGAFSSEYLYQQLKIGYLLSRKRKK